MALLPLPYLSSSLFFLFFPSVSPLLLSVLLAFIILFFSLFLFSYCSFSPFSLVSLTLSFSPLSLLHLSLPVLLFSSGIPFFYHLLFFPSPSIDPLFLSYPTFLPSPSLPSRLPSSLFTSPLSYFYSLLSLLLFLPPILLQSSYFPLFFPPLSLHGLLLLSPSHSSSSSFPLFSFSLLPPSPSFSSPSQPHPPLSPYQPFLLFFHFIILPPNFLLQPSSLSSHTSSLPHFYLSLLPPPLLPLIASPPCLPVLPSLSLLLLLPSCLPGLASASPLSSSSLLLLLFPPLPPFLPSPPPSPLLLPCLPRLSSSTHRPLPRPCFLTHPKKTLRFSSGFPHPPPPHPPPNFRREGGGRTNFSTGSLSSGRASSIFLDSTVLTRDRKLLV
ncbi:hypothetical protein C7M84_025201 [Penaeus vannamei]|uniref:Uncharacterized protein n=1 Tax=Penaeus vannamei TaxID=6689 RepID=A0A3R7PC88_PENVA|nr:hypothetical protein C7M84_025201 [Penaeus vannamei]